MSDLGFKSFNMYTATVAAQTNGWTCKRTSLADVE